MITLDTTALSLLFVPGSQVSKPGSAKPIKYAFERLECLVDRIAQSDETMLLPTPVLSEVLVKVPPEKIQEILVELNGSKW